MTLEGLADKIQDLALDDAECLPFCPPDEIKLTMEGFGNIPRYLLRVFTPKSAAITDQFWTKSLDARLSGKDHKTDIFARVESVDKRHVAKMINSHLRWDECTSDNLVSWTSSLLVALVYIFYLQASIWNELTFDNIHLCVIDTNRFRRGTFLRDMDLIRAFKSFDSELARFETLRSMQHRNLSGHYYFGEYLSQGALKIERKCAIVPARAIIDKGLYKLLPGFACLESQKSPGWANTVIKFRDKIFGGAVERHEISDDGLEAAIGIGELFGPRWRMPVVVNLVALVPHTSNSTKVLLGFRMKQYQGMVLPTAETRRISLSRKLTCEDVERKRCSPRKTNFGVCDLLPEVRECCIITRSVYKDYCTRTLGGKLPIPKDLARDAEGALRLAHIFTLTEQLKVEDPTTLSDRDMTLVDASYNSVLRRLNTLIYLCSTLRGDLANKAEEDDSADDDSL